MKTCKVAPIEDLKISSEEGKLRIRGYANTKNVADRYGDVPTGDNVYDLKEFKKNPVMLIDHNNSVEAIAGSFTVMKEDEKGLYVEAVFSSSDLPRIQHVKKLYEEGHAKALSIAGEFLHENRDHPEQLTKAKIYEISLVAVPADANSLTESFRKAFKNVIDADKKSLEEIKDIRGIEKFLESKGFKNIEAKTVISKIKNYQRDAVNREVRDGAILDELKKLNNTIKG